MRQWIANQLRILANWIEPYLSDIGGSDIDKIVADLQRLEEEARERSEPPKPVPEIAELATEITDKPIDTSGWPVIPETKNGPLIIDNLVSRSVLVKKVAVGPVGRNGMPIEYPAEFYNDDVVRVVRATKIDPVNPDLDMKLGYSEKAKLLE